MNEAYFMNIFNLPKRENVVRTLWSSQWDIVKASLHSQQSAQEERAQGLSGGGEKVSNPLSSGCSRRQKKHRAGRWHHPPVQTQPLVLRSGPL